MGSSNHRHCDRWSYIYTKEQLSSPGLTVHIWEETYHIGNMTSCSWFFPNIINEIPLSAWTTSKYLEVWLHIEYSEKVILQKTWKHACRHRFQYLTSHFCSLPFSKFCSIGPISPWLLALSSEVGICSDVRPSNDRCWMWADSNDSPIDRNNKAPIRSAATKTQKLHRSLLSDSMISSMSLLPNRT